uniref:Uncharacterized protein n=1 Tax=Timema monikensis TaxID=170555 RepID=A0A7R9DZQ2_9NEOP|nr:unnamed protein product [Timema monikensis]
MRCTYIQTTTCIRSLLPYHVRDLGSFWSLVASTNLVRTCRADVTPWFDDNNDIVKGTRQQASDFPGSNKSTVASLTLG